LFFVHNLCTKWIIPNLLGSFHGIKKQFATLIYIDLWGATYPLGAIHGAIALAYNNTLRSTLNRQVSKLGAAGLSLELAQSKPLESDDPASRTMVAFGNLVAHAPKVKYLVRWQHRWECLSLLLRPH
jgi:hypothetical protein